MGDKRGYTDRQQGWRVRVTRESSPSEHSAKHAGQRRVDRVAINSLGTQVNTQVVTR